MSKYFGEPVLVLVAGGTTLVQAILQVLIAFHVPISPAQNAALTTLTGVVLAAWARAHVTPTASLPPGVAAQIADQKTANSTGKVQP